MRPFDQPIYVTRPLLPPLDALTARLGAVWDSGWLTNAGAQHDQLESRLRAHLDVPHLSLFNNGTMALTMALKALDLTGEVITTPFTFPATPHALLWNALTPVFADIDPVTMNIDPAAIEAAIGSKTSAILAVHVFGTPCDGTAIARIAARHGLRVVYDAAHAFGARMDETPIGTLGDVSMFSFHATKLFHCAEGGALTTGDAALKARFDLLRNFGIEGESTVSAPGLNGKMNEMDAALGLLVLDMVAEEKQQRAAIKAIYSRRFEPIDGITALRDVANFTSSQQYMAIRIDGNRFGVTRDEIYDRLRRHNVIARKYFAPLCSTFPHFENLPSARRENLPVAHRVVDEILCLPLYGALTPDTVERICDIVEGASFSCG